MVGPGEIVVVFFVVEGPVVGVGHGCRRAHVLAHGLRIVQHFDLHGLVVALFATVERAVVVLVPMLVAAAAGEGRIVGERHNSPVLADQLVAGRDDAGGVDDFEYIWNEFGRNALARANRLFFALVDSLVD